MQDELIKKQEQLIKGNEYLLQLLSQMSLPDQKTYSVKVYELITNQNKSNAETIPGANQ